MRGEPGNVASPSPLLDQALDLNPPARTELVATIRGEDPALSTALEQLLSEHQRVLASDFLEAPPLAGEPPSMAGQTVGGYTLVRPLGMGGMGDDPSLRVHLLLALGERYLEHQQFTDWRRVVQRAYDDSRALTDVGLRTQATCEWALQLAGQPHEEGAGADRRRAARASGETRPRGVRVCLPAPREHRRPDGR